MSNDAESEKPNIVPKPPNETAESGDDTDDESEVLEESPCGRWQKRREEVEQRDVPGIDNAFLAMDVEEGVEVVWNEVQFSEKRNFKAQQSLLELFWYFLNWLLLLLFGTLHFVETEIYVCKRGDQILYTMEKIRQVFDNLIQLDHPNIVKFHKYWTDTKGEKPRVIFITEYMSSGSLKQFLKLTKKNNKTFQLKAWKRWCTQILSALSYLHSCDPPIIHGNLACDTIFIQHNGLIKIGSVAPDAIHLHVKTCRENIKNMHCIAPEYGGSSAVTIKVDIYAFGMCALEMAALGIHGNGDGKIVTQEDIAATLDLLENPQQKDFLEQCIQKDPAKRPTARELLFHAVLFEVHSLKLLAAHKFVKSKFYQQESLSDDNYLDKWDPNKVMAVISCKDGVKDIEWKYSNVPALELEKFLEDVKNGIYPLTAFTMMQPPLSRPRAVTPELTELIKSETPEPYDVETRMATIVSCYVRPPPEDGKHYLLVLNLRMDDKMNRMLQAELTEELDAFRMSEELVHYGFINELDREKIEKMIQDTITPPYKMNVNGVGPDHLVMPPAIPAS